MSFLEIPTTRSLYTVYTKSNCSYCDKIKVLMDEYNENVNYISCDEWLVSKRILFLNIMRAKTLKDEITFPIIFFEGKYIGGFNEYEMKMIVQNNLQNNDTELLNFVMDP
jgi:glutaredoxin